MSNFKYDVNCDGNLTWARKNIARIHIFLLNIVCAGCDHLKMCWTVADNLRRILYTIHPPAQYHKCIDNIKTIKNCFEQIIAYSYCQQFVSLAFAAVEIACGARKSDYNFVACHSPWHEQNEAQSHLSSIAPWSPATFICDLPFLVKQMSTAECKITQDRRVYIMYTTFPNIFIHFASRSSAYISRQEITFCASFARPHKHGL